ncbi:MAG: Chemotaxis protein CheY [Candidatus Methanophagaceae archaeon]|nr:MAG: Chemotaxis protein CheY [Methanophagales archaeon]KAF5431117.1 two-component system, chemotaxis family, response regulator CheY [Methanophagales archaeon]
MQKKRILIVEDAAYMREMLAEMLEQEKDRYEVVDFAVNGKEAVEKYKELKPDLVTMDLAMEVMDGIQAITEIKEYDPNALIIAITALGTSEQKNAALDAGAGEYLWKPFSIKNLFDALERLQRTGKE